MKRVSEVAGKPVEILDLQYKGYTPERARQLIDSYGEEGRKLVIQFSTIADSAYPFVYTFFFIVTIAWIYKEGNRHGVVYNHLHLFPFVLMAVDFCENFFIVRMIRQYPHIQEQTVLIGSFFTTVKWALVAIQLLMILGGLLLLIMDKIRNKGVSANE